MSFWDGWYDKAAGVVADAGDTLSGLFVDKPSGTPGTSEGGPNWSEINRVLSLPGNESARVKVAQAATKPAPVGPGLFDGVAKPFTDAFANFAAYLQTTLTKVILGIVALVVGVLLLNIFLARVSR